MSVKDDVVLIEDLKRLRDYVWGTSLQEVFLRLQERLDEAPKESLESSTIKDDVDLVTQSMMNSTSLYGIENEALSRLEKLALLGELVEKHCKGGDREDIDQMTTLGLWILDIIKESEAK